jgi:hypothetical protein
VWNKKGEIASNNERASLLNIYFVAVIFGGGKVCR